jgi:hypothetical protein
MENGKDCRYRIMQVSTSAAVRSGVEERIRFTNHHDRQILVVDLSHSTASAVEDIVRKVSEVVTKQPFHSVLIFVDFTNAALDAGTLVAMKEAAVFDKLYVKKSAWIGAEDIPYEFMQTLKKYSLREFPSFKSREEALDWLIQD